MQNRKASRKCFFLEKKRDKPFHVSGGEPEGPSLYGLGNDTRNYSGDRGNKTRGPLALRRSTAQRWGSAPGPRRAAGNLHGPRIRASLRLPRGFPRPLRFGGEARPRGRAGPHRGDPCPLRGPFQA